MKTKSFMMFVVVFLLIGFSNIVEAKLKLTPNILVCPDTRVGQSANCSYIQVKNNSSFWNATITNVSIGNNVDFAISAGNCKGKVLRPKATCNVPITFKPTLERDFDTSFMVNYYDVYGKGRVAADVYGLGVRPAVWLSTDRADFGEQTIESSSWQYITMKNIGSDTLNISNITVPLGSGFRVDSDCEDSLGVSESCLIKIFFEPTAETRYAATVEINDDAEDSPQLIEASGIGIAKGSADVNLDKTFIDFGNKLVGSSGEETITVSNTGTIALTINTIVPSGTYYSQETTCEAILDVGDSCTITVKFEPEAVGTFDGIITVNDNAGDTPQTVTLTGKGVSPNVSLSPSAIEFGNQTINKSSVEHQVVLLNSGTSDLTITSIKTSNAVYVQRNDCPSVLSPQNTCSIYIAFSPTEKGFISGLLSIYDDAIGSPQFVFLFGTGITGPDVDIVPNLYDFGDVKVGETSQPQNFDVTNTGDGDLSISSITANSDFTQTNDCPETLAEEETCTIEAVFEPKVSGNFVGLLSIYDDAIGSPHKANMWGFGTSFDVTLIPASIDFGNQTVDKPSLVHDVLLQNTGNSSIEICKIESDSSEFVQTNNCGDSLAPTAYCTISITFTPASLGETDGEITITDNASGSPHNIDLFGSGIDPVYPDVDVSPNSWNFGTVLVGTTSKAENFTVKNTGAVDVKIYSIDTNSEFVVDGNDCPETLAEGATCTVSVVFSPQSSGNFTGNIRIMDNTPDGYQLIPLLGTSTHSGDIDISISTSELDFGNVAVNSISEPQTIIVTNSGTDDLAIGTVSLEGSESMYFSKNTNCQDTILDAGKSCLINVSFNPLTEGYQKAAIMLYDDASGSPQAIPILGNGTSSGCNLTKSNTPNLLICILFMIGPCLVWRLKKSTNY